MGMGGMRAYSKNSAGMTAAAILLASAIFAFDLLLPLGVAAGVPYVALVLLGWRFKKPRSIYFLAAASSVLTITGYLLSAEGGSHWMVLVNRGLALFVIWITAVLISEARSAQKALENAHNELEAQVAARTHELSESNAKLRDSEGRLDLAIQSANFGTWSRTVPGDGVIWDERTEAIFGLKPGTFEDTMEAFLSRVHPDDQEPIKTGHHRLIEDGVPYAIDFRIFWPNGEVRHIATRASIVRGDRDSSLQIIGMLHDITERKRLEDELLRKSRLATLGQLTGTVSHELRNPLGALRSSIAAIRRVAGSEAPAMHRLVEIADRSVTRCDVLISDLLEYSRVRPHATHVHEALSE